MFVALLAVSSLDDNGAALRVDRAVAPAHPVMTMAAGVVVVQVDMDRKSEGTGFRVLEGQPPFLNSAMNALGQWEFSLSPGASSGMTSVTILFRPPSLFSVPIKLKAKWPEVLGTSRSALPSEIVDPGYPMTSVAQGAVVLAVEIDADGNVGAMETLRGIDALTEQARDAVKYWKFSPATVQNVSRPSKVSVVISFVAP
mgnify:CR=1 FL=1